MSDQMNCPDWLEHLSEEGVVNEIQVDGYPFFCFANNKLWFDSFEQLLERPLYRALWGKLFEGERKLISNTSRKHYVLVDGKVGVGKSCFLVWLIYKIFEAARLYRQQHADWENESVNHHYHSPKVVYTMRSERNQWVFELNQVARPVGVNDYTNMSYYFSDDVDVNGPEQHSSTKLILVTASDSTNKLKQYNKRAAEARNCNYKETFCSFTFDECRALFKPSTMSDKILKFRFDVVGGNPIFIEWDLNGQFVDEVPRALKDAINKVLEAMFGKEYIVPDENNDLTEEQQCGLWVINSIVSRATSKAEYDIRQTSLFMQYTKQSGSLYPIVHTFSSKFMELLSGIISKDTDKGIIETLQAIFGRTGFGCCIEYIAHRDIVDGGKNWYAIPLDGNDNTGNCIELLFADLTRFHIRSIRDIANIPNFSYALPTILNFTVVDAIVRVDHTFYLIQITTARNHSVHENDLAMIIEQCQQAVDSSTEGAAAVGANFNFVWVLEENFDDFLSHDKIKIPQFKTKYRYEPGKELKLKRKRVPETVEDIHSLFATHGDDAIMKDFSKELLLVMEEALGVKKKLFKTKEAIISTIREELKTKAK